MPLESSLHDTPVESAIVVDLDEGLGAGGQGLGAQSETDSVAGEAVEQLAGQAVENASNEQEGTSNQAGQSDGETVGWSGSQTDGQSASPTVTQPTSAATLSTTPQDVKESMLGETVQSSSDRTVTLSDGVSVSQLAAAETLFQVQNTEAQMFAETTVSSSESTVIRSDSQTVTLLDTALGCIEVRGPPVVTQDNSTVSNTTTCMESDEITETSDVEGTPYHQSLIPSDFQALPESLDTSIAPELPGLTLVDPNISSFQGQIIYLDFDGAQDVTYDGPVTIATIDVPTFRAPGNLAGQEDSIISGILTKLEETFAGSGVLFIAEKPSDGVEYSTVFVGGDDSAFSEYGSFLGLAEQVDVGNTNQADNGFVFAGSLARGNGQETAGGFAQTLAHTIAHEVGHLVGYEHGITNDIDFQLSDVAQFSVAEQVEDPWNEIWPSPAYTKIFTPDENGWGNASGILIDSKHVLTAFHVVKDQEEILVIPAYYAPDKTKKEIEENVWERNFSEEEAPYGIAKEIDQLKFPEYNGEDPKMRGYDISVLELDRPIGALTKLWFDYGYNEDHSFFLENEFYIAGYPVLNDEFYGRMLSSSGEFEHVYDDGKGNLLENNIGALIRSPSGFTFGRWRFV